MKKLSRNELLKRTAAVKPTATELVYSEDFGFGFTVISKDGVCETMGGHYIDWPLFCIPGISKTERKRLLSLLDSPSFETSLLKGTALETFLVLSDEIDQAAENAGDGTKPKAWTQSLREAVSVCDGNIYAYCTHMSWEHDLVFFGSEEAAFAYFCRFFDLEPWDSFDDDEIKRYLKLAKEPGIPFQILSLDEK